MQESTPKISVDIGTLAYWFIPLVGVVYAAGFLVVFTFSKDFGINGTELLEAKYIHVGGLFLMGCFVQLLPLFWILLRFKRGEGTDEWKPGWPGIVIYSTMFLTFYVVMAFTERSFFLMHSTLILSNFTMPVIFTAWVLIIKLPWIRSKEGTSSPPPGLVTKKGAEMVGDIVEFIMCLASVCLAGWTMSHDPLPHKLKTMFWRGEPTGADGIVLFMVLIFLYVSFTTYRARGLNVTSKASLILSGMCAVGILFYLSNLAFAYAIYPYIPSSRGGGEYIDTIPVRLVLKGSADKNVQSAALPQSIMTEVTSDESSFIILEQNSNVIFIASKKDAGGPAQWQTPDERRQSHKPKVYEIRRDEILSITYLNPPSA